MPEHQTTSQTPVSLYHGATDLGTFDAQHSLLKETGPREVAAARSQRLFTKILRSVHIEGDATNNIIITGDRNKVRTGDRSRAESADGKANETNNR